MDFVQINSASSNRAQLKAQNQARTLAVSRILQTAKKTKNFQLATLAVSAQLDKFTKVKEAMDKFMLELKKQQKDEYDKNEYTTKVKTYEKEDLEDKKADIMNTIKALTKE